MFVLVKLDDNIYYHPLGFNTGLVDYITNKDGSRYFKIVDEYIETNCTKPYNFKNKKYYWLHIFKYIYDLCIYGNKEEREFGKASWSMIINCTTEKISSELKKIMWYTKQISFGHDKMIYDEYLLKKYYVEGHAYPHPIKIN